MQYPGKQTRLVTCEMPITAIAHNCSNPARCSRPLPAPAALLVSNNPNEYPAEIGLGPLVTLKHLKMPQEVQYFSVQVS